MARLAWRHLTAAPRQMALAVAGVAVGVAVFVFTVAMMDGLVVFFTDRILKISPTLTVRSELLDVGTDKAALRRGRPDELLVLSRPPVPDDRPTIRGAPSKAEAVRGIAGVTGVSMVASSAGVLAFGTVAEPASLVGLDPVAERGVTDLWRAVSRGSWSDLARRRDGVIVGTGLADRLGVEVGDRVVATGESGASKELEVVGILAAGVGALDETTATVNLSVAQGLAGWGGDEASELRLRTAGFTDLEPVRQRVQAAIGHRTETWQETNRSALQLFRTIGVTTYLLTGFVLVVAGLGIGNKLATMILDREREIAILRACGFSRAALRGVFLLEGVLLGVAGALFGCLLSAVGIVYLQTFPIRFAPREGATLAYTELYLANRPGYYLLISAVAVTIALLASLAAVRRAVRVLPVEVLRGVA